MAALSAQTIGADGADIAFAAASAGGDTYQVTDDGSVLLVKNDDAAAKTVTIAVPATYQGLDIPDRQHTVAAGEVALIPLLRGAYRNPSTGDADITYDAVTSLSVAVVRH